MAIIVGIVGGLVLLNAALAIALLMRRDRPKARARLLAWVKGEQRRPRSVAVPGAR